MSEAFAHLKTEWDGIPTWVKIGTLAGGAGLFLLTKLGGGSAPAITTPTTPGQPTNISLIPTSTTGSTDVTGTTPPTNPQNPQNTNPNHITNPLVMGSNPIDVFGNFTNPGLSPSQSNLQNKAIQDALGPYGGQPVSMIAPYQGINNVWDQVTQTTYTGGGKVTNLGFAQPTPQPGQIIPPAVQDKTVYFPGTSIPDWASTVNQAYNYPQNFSPGMTQQAAIQNPTIAATPVAAAQPAQSPANLNLISAESAKQSAAYQASLAGGGYTSGGQAAFNAAHPLSSYA